MKEKINLHKLRFLLILAAASALFLCSCKEKITYENIEKIYANLQTSIKLPVYEDYDELNLQLHDWLEQDYANYSEEARLSYEFGSSDRFSYRIDSEDKSNGKFVNVIIHKYLYAGENVESEYIKTFVLSKKTGKICRLSDVTDRSAEEISHLCYAELMNRAEIKSDAEAVFVSADVKNGTKPDSANLACFTADKKFFYIYFAAGSALATGYGIQIVKIER